MLTCCNSVWAYDIEIDGIYYNILSDADKTVEVTYEGSSYTQFSNEYAGNVTIPNTVDYNGSIYNVISVCECAFYGCIELIEIHIPSSITSIGDYAFTATDWNGIIPDGVTSIGFSAFSCCDSLTSVTIPDSVTYIGNYAFKGATVLTNITMSNQITTIGNYAFYQYNSL